MERETRKQWVGIPTIDEGLLKKKTLMNHNRKMEKSIGEIWKYGQLLRNRIYQRQFY